MTERCLQSEKAPQAATELAEADLLAYPDPELKGRDLAQVDVEDHAIHTPIHVPGLVHIRHAEDEAIAAGQEVPVATENETVTEVAEVPAVVAMGEDMEKARNSTQMAVKTPTQVVVWACLG